MTLAVMIAEAVPTAIHGVLSRWLVKVGPSTYVGHMSARVREEMWLAVTPLIREGRVMLIHPDSSEQGYAVRSEGSSRYEVLDFDGLQLIGMVRGTNYGHEEVTDTP